MKDYSMNLDERKEYILGYDINDDGQIIVKFAKGDPWIVPYNKKNEQILLRKMKSQLDKFDDIESGLKEKMSKCFIAFLAFFGISSYCALSSFDGVNVMQFISVASVFGILSVSSFVASLKFDLKLNDLRKNKKFLDMEKKLNSNIRNNSNILVNVSKKTRDVINSFPKDKHIFNINSFNYVPYRDLEQIIENIELDQRLDLIYEEQEREQKHAKTRKKTR